MEMNKHKGIATHTCSVRTAITEKIRNKKHLQECSCTVDVNVNRNAAIIGNSMVTPQKISNVAIIRSSDPPLGIYLQFGYFCLQFHYQEFILSY